MFAWFLRNRGIAVNVYRAAVNFRRSRSTALRAGAERRSRRTLLRRQSLARDQLHLFAKTIQLAERGGDVGRDTNALKLLVLPIIPRSSPS
jgi:hypothetical protein